MKLSLNVVDDSNDENDIPHKLLLTNTQVPKLPKAFANNSSANIKLSKTELHKIEQSGVFLGRVLEPLLKTGFPLIRLGLTVAVPATDADFHKKMFRSGATTIII